MKVKRFNNLWLMGLILSAIILGAIYILKIFLPQFVIEVAHIPSITAIGHYIDNNKWAWYLATILLSFVNYYLLCCAACRKKKLNKKECLLILIATLSLLAVKEILPSQYTICNFISLLGLPYLMRAGFGDVLVIFCSTNLLQSLTLEIRNLNLMIADFNYATLMILTIDVYILLILFYFYFNYKKGD